MVNGQRLRGQSHNHYCPSYVAEPAGYQAGEKQTDISLWENCNTRFQNFKMGATILTGAARPVGQMASLA